jgi:hypothetical protein
MKILICILALIALVGHCTSVEPSDSSDDDAVPVLRGNAYTVYVPRRLDRRDQAMIIFESRDDMVYFVRNVHVFWQNVALVIFFYVVQLVFKTAIRNFSSSGGWPSP